MGITVNIYAQDSVSLSTITDCENAVGSTLDNQVNFSISTQLENLNYPSFEIDQNDKDKTLENFEDFAEAEEGLSNNEHYMLLADYNFGGKARAHVGREDSNQDYTGTYALSVVGVDASTEFIKNITIHEFIHTVMYGGYGSCPTGGAPGEHSCGRIDFYQRVSPMMTSYVDEKNNNNWDICEDNTWGGGHTQTITDCTRNRIEDYVANEV